jgi:type II secretory pathway pseudopilin PulG
MRLTPQALRNRHGSTYLALMFLIVIMAIGVTAAAKQWKTVVQREKEADLLWRGIEIQTAIQFYSTAKKLGRVIPGEVYPLTLEELTKPPKPLLRRAYKDPITGGDWQYIRQPSTEGIMGVKSASTLAPLKQHQFPAAVAHFEGFSKYSDWVFQFPSASTPQAEQSMLGQQTPGAVPGQPSQVLQGFQGQQNTGGQALLPGPGPQGSSGQQGTGALPGPLGQVPPGFPGQQFPGAVPGSPGPGPQSFPGQPVPGFPSPSPPGNSPQ